MPISYAYVGAYNVTITEEYVKSTAKCSCSLYTNYNYHTKTWLNYCPNCHHYGVLTIQIGYGNHNPEGMVVCTICDMDWCLVHGKSHDHRCKYLIHHTIPKQTPTCSKIEQVEPVDQKTLLLNKIRELKYKGFFGL